MITSELTIRSAAKLLQTYFYVSPFQAGVELIDEPGVVG